MTHIRLMAIVTIIVFCFFVTTLAFALYKRHIRRKDRLVELKCRFFISKETDETLDAYTEQTGVKLDGILGNDFMASHDYIIDYERYTIKHKSVRISIKDAMEILELPLIVLWRGNTKHVFLLDTGANCSLIHSKYTKDLGEQTVDASDVMIRGYGGTNSSFKSIEASFYYNYREQ